MKNQIVKKGVPIFNNKYHFILLLIILVGSFTMTTEARDYKYSIDAGYPPSYPMVYDYHGSYFSNAGGVPFLYFYPPSGGAVYWPEGSQATVLSEKNPLPNKIHVQWYSVIEDKFWEGEHDIDQTLLRRLEGYTVLNLLNRNEKSFTQLFSFNVYVVPGGLVSLWVSGGGETFLLAQFQAKPMKEDPNWSKFYRSSVSRYTDIEPREIFKDSRMRRAQTFIDNSLKGKAERFDISKNYLTSMPWKSLMKKYPWELKINTAYFKLTDYFVAYSNGERLYTYINTQQLDKDRSIPFEIYMYYQDDQKKLNRIDISFDNDEIMKAFQSINLLPPVQGNIALYIDFNPEYKSIFTYLVKKEHKIELKKIRGSRKNLYSFGGNLNVPWDKQTKRYK